MSKVFTILSLMLISIFAFPGQSSPPEPRNNLSIEVTGQDVTSQILYGGETPHLGFENRAPTVQGDCLYLPFVLGGGGGRLVSSVHWGQQVLFDCPPAVVSIAQTSPANGEDGVAVTRETILAFDGALDPATVTSTVFSATVDDVPISANLHLSPDNKRVTLFYPTALPDNKQIVVAVDGNQLRDSKGKAVDVNRDGQPGGIATIKFETLNVQASPGTSVCGRVVASELARNEDDESIDAPLDGVTITVDGSDTLQATTDKNGNFCLDPAPEGRFFVHIDGRTATNPIPAGAYYPSVGKAWEAVAGGRTSLRTIYLPLVAPETLQPVSQTQNTTISLPDSVQTAFPELADTNILVPADSLFADDGTRGGAVGIAPVPPTRLPGELPGALEFPIVITVQTDGATNFDIPVSACFTNLPDPVTKQVPAAGAKSALWSFNHDTGRFEVVGPMTVSADGQLVCTDAGSGIKAPGWHGSNPNTEAIGAYVDDSDEEDPYAIPNCPSFSPSFDESANVINACLNVFFPAADVAEGLLSGLNEAKALQDDLEQLIKDLETGTIDETTLSLKVAALKKVKEELKAAVDALGTGPLLPLDALQQGLACADSYLDATNNGCREIRNATTGCFYNATTNACELTGSVKDAISLVNSGIDKINTTVNDLAFEAICSITDEIVDRAGGGTQVTSSAVTPELVQLLEDLAVQYEPLETVSVTELAATQKVIDDLSGFSAAAGDSYILRQGPSPFAYVMAEYGDDNIQRARANAAGNYRFILPAETPLNLYLFDPATGLCGSYLGVSAAVGESTVLHGPLLGQCPAPDSDDDALADLAERIIGTEIAIADTDGDGVNDGDEVASGRNPLSLEITLETVVTGAIGVPNEIDRFDFTAAGGQRIYVDSQTDSGFISLRWILENENEDRLFSDWLSSDSGVIPLTLGGTYLLTINPDADIDTSPYQFRVWNVPDDDEFVISVGDIVAIDNPGPGAGNIETPGVKDVYTFAATAGQTLVFDYLLPGSQSIRWVLYDPSGAVVFEDWISATQAPHVVSQGGIYTLTVRGNFDAVGTYEFQIIEQ